MLRRIYFQVDSQVDLPNNHDIAAIAPSKCDSYLGGCSIYMHIVAYSQEKRLGLFLQEVGNNDESNNTQ